ncbi:MAG: transcription termination factor Rho, partial [Candidatus Nephrothrix sp. EaCA]
MLTKQELNDKLVSELKDMAEGIGVKNAKKFSKEELIYKILDQQAVKGETPPPPAEPQPERRRRRENVTHAAPVVAPTV